MITWSHLSAVWTIVYLWSSCIVSIGLGVLCVRFECLGRNTVSRFLLGASTAPFAQFIYTMLAFAVIPGVYIYIYIVPLPALASGYLLYEIIHRRAFQRAYRRFCGFMLLKSFPRIPVTTIITALFLALLIPLAFRFASTNELLSSDNAQYAGHAISIAKARSLTPIFDYYASEGHFSPDNHFPSFQFWESYALLHTPSGFGYPFDKPLFTAQALICVWLFLGFIGILSDFFAKQKRAWIALGAFGFFCIPYMASDFFYNQRECFRFLSYLLLLGALVNMPAKDGGIKRTRRLFIKKFICVGLFSFCASSSHILGAVVVPLLCAAWLLWRLCMQPCKATAKDALLTCIFAAGGFVLALMPNIVSLLQVGRFSAYRAMLESPSAPWYDSYIELSRQSINAAPNNIMEKLERTMFARSSPLAYIALGAVILFSFYFVVLHIKRKINGSKGAAMPESFSVCLLLVFVVLAQWIPFTGLLDNPLLYDFSKGFYAVPRYGTHWFLFATILIVNIISILADVLLRKAQCKAMLSFLLCAALCLPAIHQANRVFLQNALSLLKDTLPGDTKFTEKYSLIIKTHQEIARYGGKFLITAQGLNYPLGGEGWLLQSKPFIPLMNATASQAKYELDKLDVAVIVAAPGTFDEGYLALSGLAEYLHSLPSNKKIESDAYIFYWVGSLYPKEL